MELNQIQSALNRNRLFSGKLTLLDTTPSTNSHLSQLARKGAPEGTVLLAEEQTAGRGTSGRSFYSPHGTGLYLSVLLRPRAELPDLLTLTGRAAAAVRSGIAAATGAPCAIKWLNDIYLKGRKLCGILTELSPGGTDWVILGIGVNVSQSPADFAGQGLNTIATSLAAEGFPVRREELAAAILNELDNMYRLFPQGLSDALADYRTHCLTLGRRVGFIQNGHRQEGTALRVEDDFTLTIQASSGLHNAWAGTVDLL